MITRIESLQDAALPDLMRMTADHFAARWNGHSATRTAHALAELGARRVARALALHEKGACAMTTIGDPERGEVG